MTDSPSDPGDGLMDIDMGGAPRVDAALPDPVVDASMGTDLGAGFDLDLGVDPTDGGGPLPEPDASVVPGPRTGVYYLANFDNGEFGRAGAMSGGRPALNSGWRLTLCEGSNGVCQTGEGGVSGAGTEMQIVSSAMLGADRVTPRLGEYFLHSFIDRRNDYTNLNAGPADSVRDKPRNSLALVHDNYRFGYDTEIWYGFSVYVPSDFEVDNGGSAFDWRTLSLQEVGNRPGYNHVRFFLNTENRDDPEAQWIWEYHVNPHTGSYRDDRTVSTFVNLGSIAEDRGRWTDWVVRFRANPFARRTTVRAGQYTNAIPGTYEGNRGILEIWKSVGPARRMEQVFSRVNQPVGTAPSSTDGGIRMDFRMYKYSWKWVKRGGEIVRSPSTVGGPRIQIGWDEIRYGFARDGAGFSDVDVAHRPRP